MENKLANALVNESVNKMVSRVSHTLPAGLYIVATPIGNLRDITLRALDVLAAADTIVCEDTRVSGKLLKAYDITAPLLSYNDHSDEKRRKVIVDQIKSGKAVALISDAGSPLISDPGYKLVLAARDENLMVTAIPGASAVITAMQLSGLPSDRFCFIGFLPSKQKARRDCLAAWKTQSATLIAYETGPRLIESLGDICAVLGARRVCVARELTKMFEEVKLQSVDSLIADYTAKGAPKGEIVVLIEGAVAQIWTQDDLESALSEALKTMKTKDAASYVADMAGASKKMVYDLALKVAGR